MVRSLFFGNVFMDVAVVGSLSPYFGSWGHALLAVAVVERFKQEPMYGLSAGTKKGTVVEG